MAWLSNYAHPGLFLLVLLPVLLAGSYALASRRRCQRLHRFLGSPGTRAVPARRGPRLRHLPIVLSVIGLVALTIALAGPTRDVQIPRNRAVMVLAIDVSPSMKSTDVQPDRLTVAEDAAKQFAQRLTPGINLGLVAFAGNAELLVPPTPDHAATVNALDHLQTDDGTATGAGVFAALQAIRTVTDVLSSGGATPPPARIVLLSDGAENRPENPDSPTGAYTAARTAKSQGVPISTVALGTKQGYVEQKDQRLPVPVDDSMMKQIAALSGGQTSSADDVDALNRSYAAVAEQIGYQHQRGTVSAPWVRLGAFLFAAAVLCALFVNRRVPV